MRIGIDARLYGPRTGGGGLGRYVEQLVNHLESISHEDEYVIFLRKENWQEFEPCSPNFRKVLAPWRWYTLAEQIHMPKTIRRENLNLIHYPHFNVPLFARVPFVLTIHDLNLLEYPKAGITNLDPVRFWSKYLGYRFILKQALKKTKQIITVSNTTREAVIKRFPFVKDKIINIPLGYTKPQSKTPVANYWLPATKYILAVGNAYPHKNLVGLLSAFYEILKTKPDVKLVLTGPEDRFREKIRHRVRELGIQDSVVFTGFVDDATLNQLYKNAAAYIMPSLLEGFGFPGLEAQARGTPVLASNLPVLHDTLGDGALYFDPKNPFAMSQTIFEILNNQEVANALKTQGYKNIQRFDWNQTAQKTLEVYKSSSRKT